MDMGFCIATPTPPPQPPPPSASFRSLRRHCSAEPTFPLAANTRVAPPPLVRCSAARRKRPTVPVPPKSTNAGRGFGGAGDGKWQCVRGCGACCKLDKGPAFPTPEEIFPDDPAHLEMLKSLIGADGWCVHYKQASRSCSIYEDRPFFCRVEPGVFQELYGISRKRFNQEACGSCRDTITNVYGAGSEELKNFNSTIRNAG